MKTETKDAIIAAWRQRWYVVMNPAPGFKAAVPCSFLPFRLGVREDTVNWLFLDDKGMLSTGMAEGIDAQCVTEAANNTLPPPLFSNNEQSKMVLSLRTPQSVLPFGYIEGVAFNPSNVTQDISNIIRPEGCAMYDTFRELLDQVALTTAHNSVRKVTGIPTANLYNTYVGALPGGMEGNGEWRRQLGDRWPILAPYFMKNPDIIMTCDRGDSVPLALSKMTGLKPATLKAFSGHPFGSSDKGRPIHGKNILSLLRFADALIQGHLPNTTNEWARCREVAVMMERCFSGWTTLSVHLDNAPHEHTRILTERFVQDIFSRSGKPWVETPRVPVNRRIEDGMAHITDAARALHGEVIVHALRNTMREEAERRGAAALFEGRSLHSTYTVSARHLYWLNLPHRLAAAAVAANGFNAEGAVEGVDSKARWEPLAKDAEFDGCKIINLTSSYALSIEGAEMSHCVSQYDSMCAMGVGSILSIIADNGTRSTAEIRLSSKKGRILEINQHRGSRNKTPDKKCTDALNKYLKTIEEDNLINASRLQMMKQFNDRPARNCAYYDYRYMAERNMTPEQIQSAWRRWKGWLDTDAPDAETWLRSLPVFSEVRKDEFLPDTRVD